jgi:hypothetical protein
MILRFFRQSHPVTLVILLPLMAVLLWIPAFLTKDFVNTRNSMPLMELVSKPFVESTWVLSLIGLLFNIGSALIFSLILEKFDVLERKSNIPALLFIVLASGFRFFLDFHPLQPAVFLLLISTYRIFQSYQSTSALSNAFDSGFFLGLAILFYFPFFWFMPFLWTALLIVRPFVWREYALSFLGALLPIFFAVSYYYFIDSLPNFWFDKIVFALSERSFQISSYSWSFWGVFICGCFILFLSLGTLLKRLNNSIVRAKNIIQVFLIFGFFSIFIVFITGIQQAFIFYLFIVPIALIWSNYFVSLKKQWLAEILITAYLILVFINQYFS